MMFPINEKEFVNMWLEAIGNPDNADKALAEALASAMNKAYHAGLEAGRKSCDVTTQGDTGLRPY